MISIGVATMWLQGKVLVDAHVHNVACCFSLLCCSLMFLMVSYFHIPSIRGVWCDILL